MKTGLVLVLAAGLVAVAQAGTGILWPQPRTVQRGNLTIPVNAVGFDFALTGRAAESDILQEAVRRYRALCFPRFPSLNDAPAAGKARRGAVGRLVITVQDVSEVLELDIDESYTLNVNENADATISAVTVFGALHGLETFSQLVVLQEDTETYQLIGPVSVDDAPRYPWRGLLLDTSRHYLSLDTLRRTIDALSYVKMNVFHWHIVDAEAFPLVSNVHPLLHQKGAYGPKYIYTQEQIKELQTYAKYRGVRVVPEIDSPGHTESWGRGYPEVMAKCPLQAALSTFNSALDPTKNSTYEFVEKLLAEMAPVFADDFLHIGGDELNYACWGADADIREYIRQQGIDLKGLFREYWLRLLEIVARVGKRTVCWEEVFTDGLNPPRDGMIHVWTNRNYLPDVVKGGYPALLSAGWYLDRQLPLGDEGDKHYMWLDTWRDMYENEPERGELTPEEAALIRGGEATMWGEQIDDKTVDERVWPRAAAVAERLWSPKDVRLATAAWPRFRLLYCHLSTRGIATSPIFPGPPCVV